MNDLNKTWDVGDEVKAERLNNQNLKVVAQDTPDLTLKVRAGVCIVENTLVKYAGGNTPTISAPAANPRIDLITIDDTGTIGITAGAEAGSPSAPSYPSGVMVLAEVYCKVGMTEIVNNDDTGKGYIYRDSRPMGAFAANPFLREFTADENLTAGQSVGLSNYLAGKVARAIRKVSTGTLSFTPAANPEYQRQICPVGADKFVVAMPENDNESIRCFVVSVDQATKTISIGTPATPTADGDYGRGYTVCKLATDKFVIFYMEDASTTIVKYRVGTISGTTISWGAAATAFTGGSAVVALAADFISTDKGVVVMKCTTTPTNSRVFAFTCSTTTLTFGTGVALGTTAMNMDVPTLIKKIGTDKFFMFSPGNGSGAYGQAGTISGTAITLGSEAQISASAVQSTESWMHMISPATDVVVITYGVGNQLYMNAATISGTTITAGTQLVNVKNSTIGNVGLHGVSGTVILVFTTDDNAAREITRSGANLTNNGIAIQRTSTSPSTALAIPLDSGTGYVSVGVSSTTFGAWIQGMSNMFLGFAQSSVSRGAAVQILMGGIDANQTNKIPGALYTPDGAGGLTLIASSTTFNTPDDKFVQALSTTEVIL